MKAITISIGTFIVKVRSEGTHDKGQEEIIFQVDWCTLRQAWQAGKEIALQRLFHLLVQYDQHLRQKEEQRMAKWPPHNIFCEKRCCQKSLRSYMRFLKKELRWGTDGHIL